MTPWGKVLGLKVVLLFSGRAVAMSLTTTTTARGFNRFANRSHSQTPWGAILGAAVPHCGTRDRASAANTLILLGCVCHVIGHSVCIYCIYILDITTVVRILVHARGRLA